MAYKKTNYLLNKNSNGIIYKYADGTTLELTYEKIVETHPDFTEEEFIKLKEISDEMYREEALSDWHHEYYVKESIDQGGNCDGLISESIEDEFFNSIDSTEKRLKIKTIIEQELTTSQRRRLLLHSFKKMSEREIAELEGVDRHAVHNSISAAQKKLKKFLKK
ncbi:sigma-70 region 4 domain-containing protein [bacterium]|nr:sigma-70 region 4 domain-containing protein [bacterium]